MQNNRHDAVPIPFLNPTPARTTLFGLIEAHQHALVRVDNVSDADQDVEAGCDAEESALENLLSYSPQDMAEVQAKAAYFIDRLEFLGCEDPRMLMFMRAML
ncbi:hypothetical protein [Phyllobacterium sp. 22552]|uniref:hypothetical protein n=1 Tax=Phyllobacterium sp. 22552 TaxID=3453941 RepID=UPI003F86F255